VLEAAVDAAAEVVAAEAAKEREAAVAGGPALPAFADPCLPSPDDLLATACCLCAAAGAREGSGAALAVPLLEGLVRSSPARFLRPPVASLLSALYEALQAGDAMGVARSKRVLQGVAAAYHLAPSLPPALFRLPPA
jgi:hypothetical protein